MQQLRRRLSLAAALFAAARGLPGCGGSDGSAAVAGSPPPPPPQAPGTSHSTNFDLSENPIAEGGLWTNGGAVGLDWTNVQTNGALAYANALITSGYADNIAILALPNATSRHYAQATFHVVAGYSPILSHECELLTGFTVAAHVAKGYECLWPIGAAYPIWVRWNGDIANFTYAGASDDNLGSGKSWRNSSTDTFVGPPKQGDVFKVVYDASSGSPVLTAYLNGAVASTITDTSAFKIVTGRPGIGFFVRSGGTPQNYCYDAFAGGIL